MLDCAKPASSLSALLPYAILQTEDDRHIHISPHRQMSLVHVHSMVQLSSKLLLASCNVLERLSCMPGWQGMKPLVRSAWGTILFWYQSALHWRTTDPIM